MSAVRDRITNFSRRFKTQPPTAIEKEAAAAQAKKQAAAESSPTSSSPAGTAHTSSTRSSPASSLNLRAPQNNRTGSMLLTSSSNFTLPDLPWLCGTWHVTHSSLPMWRDKRNVRIMYTRIGNGDKLDDVVTYQGLRETGLQRVHGVDRQRKDGSYTWRGKGVLKVASSRWEVLGWGGGGNSEEQWVVTYFAKTVFTPAGIDIYSRRQGGLSEATLRKLLNALKRLDGSKEGSKATTEFGRLVSQLFEVKRDDARAALTP